MFQQTNALKPGGGAVERFTLGATEAAMKAGYSKKTAYSIGQRLLKNVEIENYLSEHRQKAHNSRIATAEEVLEFLSGTMRNEEIGRKERLKAAELLGKRYALFEDRRETDNQTPVNIEINIEDCRDEDNDT